MSEPRLRVGIVDYLNAWPLAWGFRVGAFDGRFDARYLPPAQIADELAEGKLDVGLVPSIEVQRTPDLLVVPGLCIASTREVRSVILVSRCPMERIRRLALDRNSRTSAALVRILLESRHGVVPDIIRAPPDPEAMLASADAALIIGDPALRIDRGRYRVWDLAAEWHAATGLPFVFAVWALRSDVVAHAEGLAEALRRSLELGLERLDEIVDRAEAELGLPAPDVRRYLLDQLAFRLDAEALAGLREFYSRAADLGLLGEPEALRFLGE